MSRSFFHGAGPWINLLDFLRQVILNHLHHILCLRCTCWNMSLDGSRTGQVRAHVITYHSPSICFFLKQRTDNGCEDSEELAELRVARSAEELTEQRRRAKERKMFLWQIKQRWVFSQNRERYLPGSSEVIPGPCRGKTNKTSLLLELVGSIIISPGTWNKPSPS